MSKVKTIGKIIGGFLLAILLSLLLGALAFSQITTYDSIKPIAEQAVRQQINNNDVNFTQVQSLLNVYCTNTKAEKVNVPNTDFNITCSDITSGKDIVSIMTDSMLSSIYYKQYNCEFLDCPNKLKSPDNIFIFLSAKSNKFFNDLVPILAILTIISAALLYFSCETLHGKLKSLGTCFFVSGLPYFMFLGFEKLPLFPKEIQPYIADLMKPIQNDFLIVLAIGIILLIAGFIVGWKRKGGKK